MKRAFRIALLGILSIGAIPALLSAQSRDHARGDWDNRNNSGYAQQRGDDRGRNDRRDFDRRDFDRRGDDRRSYDRRDYDRRNDDRAAYGRDGYSDNRYQSGYVQGYSYAPGYEDNGDYRIRNNGGRSAAIIGGSAAAGAVIGAAAGHGQGAAVGALVGGITGLIIDQATRDHHNHY